MKQGTKSLLFGVHQILWHPLTVALAWKRVHKRWPTWIEAVAIFVHDWGYWGCDDMDGECGREHPEFSAGVADWIAFHISHWILLNRYTRAQMDARIAYELVIGHSVGFLKNRGVPKSFLSDLYLPDKVCVLCEPRWFYMVRGVLSGEIWEYVSNSRFSNFPRTLRTAWQWLNCYRRSVESKL